MLRTILLFALLIVTIPVRAQSTITPFVENVTTHVLIHELAHALIREFDLPVLGNEENIADGFSTLFIAETMPERAEAVIKDRARSWLVDAAEVASDDIDLRGEHAPDARRAYRAVCWLCSAGPEAYAALPAWIGLSPKVMPRVAPVPHRN